MSSHIMHARLSIIHLLAHTRGSCKAVPCLQQLNHFCSLSQPPPTHAPGDKLPERVCRNTEAKQAWPLRSQSLTYALELSSLFYPSQIVEQPHRHCFCYPGPPLQHPSNLSLIYLANAFYLFRINTHPCVTPLFSPCVQAKMYRLGGETDSAI